ncbi:MAG: hypothetical protein MUF10_15390 [Thermoanaerobaculaceae bacterium]|jgi:hypothetical protein|nr:hypothetical protein [Thermoanaerobaculaceae bacterium]
MARTGVPEADPNTNNTTTETTAAPVQGKGTVNPGSTSSPTDESPTGTPPTTVAATALATKLGIIAPPALTAPPVVRSAAELLRAQATARTVNPVRRKILSEGGRMIVRPVTDKIVPAAIHYKVPMATGRFGTYLCLAPAACAMCLSGQKPSSSGLVLLYCVDDRDLGVVVFDVDSGPGALGAQLLEVLARPDHLRYILDVSKSGGRYQVLVLKVLEPGTPTDGIDYGDAALRDLIARKAMPTPAQILGTIEILSNQALLLDSPATMQRLRIYHPEIDPATL